MMQALLLSELFRNCTFFSALMLLSIFGHYSLLHYELYCAVDLFIIALGLITTFMDIIDSIEDDDSIAFG